MPAPSGLISWWPGDGNANDIQGGNNGTLINGATFAAGMVSQAFSFGGVDAHIALGNIFDGLSTGFTLDAWIKTTSIVGNKAIIAKYWTTGSSWVIRTNEFQPSKVDFTVCSPSCQTLLGHAVQLLSTSSINDGAWHFIAATFDGTTQRLYIDGNLEASGINTNPAWSDNHPLCIGASCDFNGNAFSAFAGLIDEVEIFNRALTAAEIQSIYLAGAAGKCKGGPPPVNLPPVADAGASRQVKVGEQVILDGSKSYDPEGQQITPSWSFLSRPAGSASQLTGAATLQPSFVPDQGGDYKVRLDITDPEGAVASALVTITASSNRPPVAVIARVSGNLKAPTEKVLDGRGSSDPDGDKISFKWRLAIKPAASTKGVLSGVTRPDPTLVMDVAGDYVVELTVWDTKELSGTTQRKITALGGGGGSGGDSSPVSCFIRQDFAPNTSEPVQYVECNGKQISPYAYSTSRPGYPMELLAPIPGQGGVGLTSSGQSVAYWSHEYQSTTGLSPKTTTYEANCTRNPLAQPVTIAGPIVEDLTKHEVITDFKIVGSVVTSKICKFGNSGCTNYTKLLPSGCSTK